jgi:hypothetical protein
VGTASGDGGRRLGVRGGCTWRRGAQGVVKMVRERPERAVRGGSTVAGMTAQWGAKSEGGRKGAPRWRWVPSIAGRGGGRRAAWRKNGGEKPWAR